LVGGFELALRPGIFAILNFHKRGPRSDLAVLAKNLKPSLNSGEKGSEDLDTWPFQVEQYFLTLEQIADTKSAPGRPLAQGPSCQLVQGYDAAQPYHSNMGGVCIKINQDVHAHWLCTEGQAAP